MLFIFLQHLLCFISGQHVEGTSRHKVEVPEVLDDETPDSEDEKEQHDYPDVEVEGPSTFHLTTTEAPKPAEEDNKDEPSASPDHESKSELPEITPDESSSVETQPTVNPYLPKEESEAPPVQQQQQVVNPFLPKEESAPPADAEPTVNPYLPKEDSEPPPVQQQQQCVNTLLSSECSETTNTFYIIRNDLMTATRSF